MKKIKNNKVLIVEDDISFGTTLKDYLELNNYDVTIVIDGEKGLDKFKNNHYDICILDVMLPLKDGFSLASDIKSINENVPIIFLTAKTQTNEVIEGYKRGADDYIKKPFEPEVLLYKLDILLKRAYEKKVLNKDAFIFNIGKYIFDKKSRKLKIGEDVSKLSPKECNLLSMLCDNIGDVVSRDLILIRIWKSNNYFTTRSMDVYITKLRKKLSKDKNIEIINVQRGGFSLIINTDK